MLTTEFVSIYSECNKYRYYSFKIFPRFWLVKTTRIIHYNQLLLTKFGKNFVILDRWRQNDVKSAALLRVILNADRGTSWNILLVLRWLDPVFWGGYHPTLKLSGIPTFTFIVSLTHRMDQSTISLYFGHPYNRWVLASLQNALGPCKCARFRAHFPLFLSFIFLIPFCDVFLSRQIFLHQVIIHLSRLDEWTWRCAGILRCEQRFLSGVAHFSIYFLKKK